jgi:hypothetical protein
MDWSIGERFLLIVRLSSCCTCDGQSCTTFIHYYRVVAVTLLVNSSVTVIKLNVLLRTSDMQLQRLKVMKT